MYEDVTKTATSSVSKTANNFEKKNVENTSDQEKAGTKRQGITSEIREEWNGRGQEGTGGKQVGRGRLFLIVMKG